MTREDFLKATIAEGYTKEEALQMWKELVYEMGY